jgi:hypothetical protein
MNIHNARDEGLIAFYRSVRRQVRADMQSGGRYCFDGGSTKQHADTRFAKKSTDDGQNLR